MPVADRSAALSALLEPAVREAGLVLERVSTTPAGRRSVVRVVVDLPGGPGSLDLDAVAAASRAVSAVLDGPAGDAALGSAPYVLEVTSPGVDRPLTERRHWSRAQGRLVEVVLPGGEVLAGRVGVVDDDGVAVDGRRVPWAGLEETSGRVQVELSRPVADEDGVDEADEADEGGVDGGREDGAGADEDESDETADERDVTDEGRGVRR